ncbi:MAG: hypothetical protein ACYC1A_05175 [Spirochaetales bacterium]
MKKFVLVGMFVLTAVGFAFASGTDTSNLAVSANITPILDVNATAGAAITLSTAGAADVSVGTVTVLTNNKNWKIEIATANDLAPIPGSLRGYKNEIASSFYIPYKFKLVGDLYGVTTTLFDTTLGGSGWTSAEMTKTLSSRTTPGSTPDSFAATISYAAEDGLNWFADHVYQDTITLTVTAL